MLEVPDVSNGYPTSNMFLELMLLIEEGLWENINYSIFTTNTELGISIMTVAAEFLFFSTNYKVVIINADSYIVNEQISKYSTSMLDQYISTTYLFDSDLIKDTFFLNYKNSYIVNAMYINENFFNL